MQRLQAYRFELMPNGQQQRAMRSFAGSCRYVYNQALHLQQERYKAGEKKLGYAGLCKVLTAWKKQAETDWLNNTPSQALQQALKDLERAYKNFFEKRAEFPRFRKKGRADSFRYPQGIQLEQGNNRIFLPKLGWVRYRNSRNVQGQVKNVTVSQSAGKWFVSIQTEREVDQPLPKATTAIANARKDFLHKASSQISQNHAMIVIEDLPIRNMSRSASGTRERPGNNVKAKSGLSRSILDQGWGEFRRQLEYKTAWNGGWLIAVPPQHTSQTCPACGHVSKDNRQTQARFHCVECGFENHADVVGAINILRAGHARFACEVSDAVRSPAAGTHRGELASVG
ncbi:transposase [Advenella alkanexedens]|uniref:Transposase n=1 Tax=Advenella alkanexedens TaxID=1481665 RepID=A0ABS6NQ38_9BURK|nr:RNA-guided endonuclease TnpB family protein [Advenella alkanexedens]MBV4397735.1 transposase [Advenella alkanexedens]